MKTLFYSILTSLMLAVTFACNTTKDMIADDYTVNVVNVHNMSTDTFSVMQRDSMIQADRLPKYNKWAKTYMQDGSTNKAYEYATLYDPETGIVYTVKRLKDENLYIVMKRQTISNE